jgi:hypothetical protein
MNLSKSINEAHALHDQGKFLLVGNVFDLQLAKPTVMQRSCPLMLRFLQLPWARKLLYAEACIFLIVAWFSIRMLPFRWWKPALYQSPKVREPGALTERDLQVQHDLQTVYRQLNWALRGRATCLMLVFAARCMLNARRIPGRVCFGLRRTQVGASLHAHAWLISSIGIVGHEGTDEFTVVETVGS